MKSARLPVVLLLALIALIATAITIRHLARNPGNTIRDKVGRRICLECGHMWHMKVSDIMEERMKDPSGNRWVKCPVCGAWKGVPVRDCARCGKAISAVVETVDDAGNAAYVGRELCDDCVKELSEEGELDSAPGEQSPH